MLILFVIINLNCFGQLKFNKAELSLSTLIDPYRFTNDSLVLKNNRGKNSLADETNTELLLSFQLIKIRDFF